MSGGVTAMSIVAALVGGGAAVWAQYRPTLREPGGGQVIVQGSGNITRIPAGASSVIVQGTGNVTLTDGSETPALPPERPAAAPSWCSGCDGLAVDMRWAWTGGDWAWRCATCRAEASMPEVQS